MDNGRDLIIKYLREAESTELALVTTLRAHISMTKPGNYRSQLERHLGQTQGHADRVRQRLSALGFRQKPLQAGMGIAQAGAAQVLTLAKGPMDMLRGQSVEEKMLKNARDEATTEALEIATYDAIESLARNLGDNETAELASRIRSDEEEMLEILRNEIPKLTEDVLRSQGASVETVDVGGDDVPIASYDSLTADEVVSKLRDLSEDDVAKVAAYERRHKNRTSVLRAAQRRSVST